MRDLSPFKRLCRFAFWKHAWPFSFFATPSLCFPDICVTFLSFVTYVACFPRSMRDLSPFCRLCRLLSTKHAWPFSLLSPMSLAFNEACMTFPSFVAYVACFCQSMRDLPLFCRLYRLLSTKHAWPSSLLSPISLAFTEACVTFLLYSDSVALPSENMRDLSLFSRLRRFAFLKHAWPFSFFAPPSLCFPEICVTFLSFVSYVACFFESMRDLPLFCRLYRLLIRKHVHTPYREKLQQKAF